MREEGRGAAVGRDHVTSMGEEPEGAQAIFWPPDSTMLGQHIAVHPVCARLQAGHCWKQQEASA